MRLSRFLPLLCLIPSFAGADEAPRKWTDTTGRSFEGSYVSATDAKVTIKRADGKVFEVERARLSKDDQDYLATAAKSAPATSAPTAAKPQFIPGDYRAQMLAGYEGTSPNFNAPWPKDAGIDKEPEITTVEENAGEKRFIYESPHFRFESNVVLRPSLVAKVAMMFEACYQTHHDLPFNNRRTRSPKAPKLRAYLFETMAEYHTAGGPSGSSGVYMGGEDKFLVPLEGLGVKKVGSGYMFDYSGNFHTVYHEITHQLWADLGDYAGIWMIEGFAEFVASAPYSNGKFSFIKQPSYALEYATGFGKKDEGGRGLGKEFSMPHLEQIMNWSQPQFYQNGNKNYGLGMLLVYYFILLDGDGTGAKFKDCIKASQEGKSREEALKVLLSGRSYADLEKEVSTAFKKKGIKISFE
ncbi:SHD1 domain-containing protein [Luteolibacter sp. LG18]|uniref:SHD1 domain-containing protein n=1 Tax=Luteolibacter sp. LG18 TaxID=2819286 RepID=UPI002B293F69|nr:hypothetical protein llg_24850 [Luteolibacter sp. LG18]